MVLTFGQTLNAPAASGLTASNRKSAVRHAVEHAMLGTSACMVPVSTQHAAIDGMDLVLKAAGKCQGNTQLPKVPDAVGWLRQKGPEGIAAAGLFGKLPRARNQKAHPLVGRTPFALEALAPKANHDGMCADTDTAQLEVYVASITQAKALRRHAGEPENEPGDGFPHLQEAPNTCSETSVEEEHDQLMDQMSEDNQCAPTSATTARNTKDTGVHAQGSTYRSIAVQYVVDDGADEEL